MMVNGLITPCLLTLCHLFRLCAFRDSGGGDQAAGATFSVGILPLPESRNLSTRGAWLGQGRGVWPAGPSPIPWKLELVPPWEILELEFADDDVSRIGPDDDDEKGWRVGWPVAGPIPAT